MINWSNFYVFFSTGIPSALLFLSLFVTIALIVLGIFCGKVKNKGRFTLFILLLEYLFIVVCSTIIFRGRQSFEFARLELEPFWTYKAVIEKVPGVSVWDIILNVVLFLPLGFLVKLIWSSVSIIRILLIALLCSLIIETNQYIFEKGVAQIDDVMHNVIGAAIGWFISSVLVKYLVYNDERTTN